MENGSDYILSVSNLSVTLQNQKILDNVNFKVEKGTTLAVLGPNGAGKTVLFKTLLNLVPYNGKIDGKEK
jgi:zinc transport system ATP-binding protein